MRPVAEPMFQAMLDAAPDAMVGVREDGIIVMANIQTEAVFGYAHPELLGRSVELLVPESARDVHPSHREAYFREPRTRPMGIGLALTGRKADGTEFPAEISLSSIETEDGTVAIAAIRDVTDRRRAAVETQEARAEADRAAAALRVTNRELESFSYAVAHDLRAPLRAIDGFSLAIVEDQADALDDAARRHLDRIRTNVHAMSEMIDGLLGLSRLTRASLALTDIDLSAIAQESGATLREVEPDRRVDLVVEPGISARADEQLLRLTLKVDDAVLDAYAIPTDLRAQVAEHMLAYHANRPGFDNAAMAGPFLANEQGAFTPEHARRLQQLFDTGEERDLTSVELGEMERLVAEWQHSAAAAASKHIPTPSERAAVGVA